MVVSIQAISSLISKIKISYKNIGCKNDYEKLCHNYNYLCMDILLHLASGCSSNSQNSNRFKPFSVDFEFRFL